MLNSETLEVGIGMVFLFLMMSLICTALQEWLEGIFKWRAMDLERGVRTLLDDSDGTLTSFLYRHPLVYSLFQGRYEPAHLVSSATLAGSDVQHVRLRARRHLPSYIPSSSFAMAFLDLVGRGPVSDAEGDEQDASSEPLTVALLRQRAAALSSPHLRRVMLSAIDHCGGNMDKLRTHIQDWFDGTMNRAGGWYKRRTQAVLFMLGILMACTLNVDSLHVMQRLTADKAFRDVVVKQAGSASALDAGKEAPALARLSDARNEIDSVGMPVGWRAISDGRMLPWVPRQLCRSEYRFSKPLDSFEPPPCVTGADEMYGWFRVFAGWLVTALAVMLGAPFWFDTLNKLMVIRSTIKPKDKSPDDGGSGAGAQEQLLKDEPAAAPLAQPSLELQVSPAQEALPAPAPVLLLGTAASAPAPVAQASSFDPHQWRPGYTNPHNEVTI